MNAVISIWFNFDLILFITRLLLRQELREDILKELVNQNVRLALIFLYSPEWQDSLILHILYPYFDNVIPLIDNIE